LELDIRVAPASVLERLRIGLDTDDRCGGAREHARAVALAAGHVDHPLAPDTLRDPLVDDQVAPVPVVLLRHVGERPLAGQRERRNALRLVALYVGALHRRRLRWGCPAFRRPPGASGGAGAREYMVRARATERRGDP